MCLFFKVVNEVINKSLVKGPFSMIELVFYCMKIYTIYLSWGCGRASVRVVEMKDMNF